MLCKRQSCLSYESCLSHLYFNSRSLLFLINFNSQQRHVGPRRTVLLIDVITIGIVDRITEPRMAMWPVVLPEPFSGESSDEWMIHFKYVADVN